MYTSNNMNSFPFSRIPTIWFVSRREDLETYHEEFSSLREKVTRFAGGQNVVAVLESAESLQHLIEQVHSMEEMFESNLSPYVDEYDPYNKNNLRRIRELALSISSNLETIARQVSWGMRADAQIGQVRRNLYPLLRGLEDTLEWLEQGT
jgi:hypothetical protein